MLMDVIVEDSAPQVSRPWSHGTVVFFAYRHGEELFIKVKKGVIDPRTDVPAVITKCVYPLRPLLDIVSGMEPGDEFWANVFGDKIVGSSGNRGFVVAALRKLRVLEATHENEQEDPKGAPSRRRPEFVADEWWATMLSLPTIRPEDIPDG
ncbi:MAG: hypothetical protein HC888_17550 [Candidatus Competibacteraceae bacterium]|nr:hypothetical protein [Candidatus Competibacteraceae bacterium]